MNTTLDRITSHLLRWINQRGFKARVIPASHIVDESDLLGNISHKALARVAGLGWLGKNLLLVSPKYGLRIRLVTVLTDMPLRLGHPAKNRCGQCIACVEACLASAIKNFSTESYYEDRYNAVHMDKCYERLREFEAMPDIGALICGVCITVCPFGKKTKRPALKNRCSQGGNYSGSCYP